MLADTTESSADVNNEAMYFSAFTFFNKTAMGLAAVIVGWALQSTGFKPNVTQNVAATNIVQILFSVLPALCFALAALPLFWYKEAKPET